MLFIVPLKYDILNHCVAKTCSV